jgi:FkbM family methyltransferase
MTHIFEQIRECGVRDAHVLVQEVVDLNCYGVFPDELVDSTVIDIGANMGLFSILAVLNGAKQVYAFEPNQDNYQRLLKYITGFDNINPINLAVTKPGLLQINIEGKDGQCQVREGGEGDVVRCIPLEEFVRDIPGDDLLMKLDCEGSEYDIIFTCPQKTLRRFKYIYTEVHNDMHPNQSYNYDMFEEYMNSIGFESQRTTPTAGEWHDDGTFTAFEVVSNHNIKFTRI